VKIVSNAIKSNVCKSNKRETCW